MFLVKSQRSFFVKSQSEESWSFSRSAAKKIEEIMEKSASFPAYSLGTTLSAQAQGCYLGIEPLLQRAASTGDAELLLTLLKVCLLSVFKLKNT